MNQIVYGNRCKCYGNCTHSYFITVLRHGIEVASMWRSGGMLADEYIPSQEVYEREYDETVRYDYDNS